jgi:hypothetical protein
VTETNSSGNTVTVHILCLKSSWSRPGHYLVSIGAQISLGGNVAFQPDLLSQSSCCCYLLSHFFLSCVGARPYPPPPRSIDDCSLSYSANESTMARGSVSRAVRLTTDAGTHEPETGTRLANFAVCRTGDGISHSCSWLMMICVSLTKIGKP